MNVFYYPDDVVAIRQERMTRQQGDKTTDVGFAATIGFFDGVHRGHEYLLRQLRRLAGHGDRNIDPSLGQVPVPMTRGGMRSMAVTFDRHPREVVDATWQPQLLTTLDEKVSLLSATGIDMLVVLRFDRQTAGMTAREFMDVVLHRNLGVRALLTGYDNRFGHDRTETFDDYVGYGRELGIDVVRAQPLTAVGGVTFSSSLARKLLAEGNVEEAAKCLGHHYSITGTVAHGLQNGRTMGFPTANTVADDARKIIPARGAYAVEAVTEDGTVHHAMTNIGTCPTFRTSGQQDVGGGGRQTMETHIFADVGDIYGQRLTLRFVARLRDETPFASPTELAAQLAKDKANAEKTLSKKQSEQ